MANGKRAKTDTQEQAQKSRRDYMRKRRVAERVRASKMEQTVANLSATNQVTKSPPTTLGDFCDFLYP